MKCVYLIVSLALSASAFSAESAIADREKLESLCDAISRAPSFAFTIHFPESEIVATFSFAATQDQNRPPLRRDSGAEQGPTNISVSGLTHVMKEAFTTTEQPGPKFVFRIPNMPEVVAYPKRLPESTYALKLLLGKNEFAAWSARNIVPPPNACPVQECEEYSPKAPWSDAVEIKAPTPESESALKRAKAIYDARRPELIARFNRSYLFYSEADTSHWTTLRKDKTWYARTHCADKMYYAVFILQLELAADGSPQCTQIHAGEFFKGE